MDALPMTVGLLATAISWPDPNDAGDVLLPKKTFLQVQALIAQLTAYLRVQLERCGKDK